MRIAVACGLDLRSRAGFWKNDTAPVCAIRTIQYNNLLFYLLLLLFIIHQTRRPAALYFRHSRTLLSSTPKIAAGLRFPFSSAHRVNSSLNFAIYDSLLDFRHPSSVTTAHDKLEQATPTFQQLRVQTHIQRRGAGRPAACDLNLWKQISQNTSAADGAITCRPLPMCFD